MWHLVFDEVDVRRERIGEYGWTVDVMVGFSRCGW